MYLVVSLHTFSRLQHYTLQDVLPSNISRLGQTKLIDFGNPNSS